MSTTITISCILNTTNPIAELGFEAWIDNNKFIDIDHVTGEQPVQLEIPEDEGDHNLRFVLKNKKDKDTVIDDSGNIVSDATLTISDLAFDDIKLGYIGSELAVYTHNFNGSGDQIETKFYGVMGCNGTVDLKFSTPIYMWLLEHM